MPPQDTMVTVLSSAAWPDKGRAVMHALKVTDSSAAQIASRQQDYNINSMGTNQFKLVDNFHIEHRLRRAYFIDGLGSHQQTTNLSTGERVWLALEFPVAHSISSARIIFGFLWGAVQLRGPVT